MDEALTLYDTCLQTVCIFLRDEMWTGKANPFHFLPTKIIEDLIPPLLKLQQLNGFNAQDLKLLFTSGRIRELKLNLRSFLRLDDYKNWRRKNYEVEQEFCQALKFLTTASENLELLEILNDDDYPESPQLSEALNGLLMNSPNLKHVHIKVKFDLKVLRHCKSLQSIMLHFEPKQPWYDFLGEEQGSLKPLYSIKIFMICNEKYSLSSSVESKYLEILLRHCPSLTSLGHTETSQVLAKLYRSGFPAPVKLRTCRWSDSKYSNNNPKHVQDAVTYQPFVEELTFKVNSVQSVSYLKRLKFLYLLEIEVHNCDSNLTEEFGSVLKEMGAQLKYLSLWGFDSTDISILLKNCPNLEVLEVNFGGYQGFSVSAVRLPNLKSLTFITSQGEGHLMSVLSDCHSLEAIFLIGLDDEYFDMFLKRNTLLNLKTAYFESCDLLPLTFKEFLLSASNLEKIEVDTDEDYQRENDLKNVLKEINHKARFNEELVSRSDEFFHKRLPCKYSIEIYKNVVIFR